MDPSALWSDVLDELLAHDVHARVVPVSRLDEVRARADQAIAGAGFPPDVAAELAADLGGAIPEALPAAGEVRDGQPANELRGGAPEAPRPVRSVLVAAVARPLTQANLTWRGETRPIQIPPHYAGYTSVPEGIAQRVDDLLRPFGFSAVKVDPPLKTLAACAGLARYGRNNITYVDGLGSWLQLAACVSDAPPPADAPWDEPQLLGRCERCSACLRACPTEAIAGERFVLHTELCLTYHNENRAPFPGWMDTAIHHCAVGCLRCQQACPENVRVDLVQAAPEWFDEDETQAILDAEHADDEWAGLGPVTREKLARCGLDYSPRVIARNIRVLLGA